MNRADLAHTKLLGRLESEKDAFVLIQEPYTFKNKLVRKPKGYDCYPTTYRQRPRMALYVRKELKFTELNTLSDKDCTAAFGKINGSPIVIYS